MVFVNIKLNKIHVYLCVQISTSETLLKCCEQCKRQEVASQCLCGETFCSYVCLKAAWKKHKCTCVLDREKNSLSCELKCLFFGVPSRKRFDGDAASDVDIIAIAASDHDDNDNFLDNGPDSPIKGLGGSYDELGGSFDKALAGSQDWIVVGDEDWLVVQGGAEE